MLISSVSVVVRRTSEMNEKDDCGMPVSVARMEMTDDRCSAVKVTPGNTRMMRTRDRVADTVAVLGVVVATVVVVVAAPAALVVVVVEGATVVVVVDGATVVVVVDGATVVVVVEAAALVVVVEAATVVVVVVEAVQTPRMNIELYGLHVLFPETTLLLPMHEPDAVKDVIAAVPPTHVNLVLAEAPF